MDDHVALNGSWTPKRSVWESMKGPWSILGLWTFRLALFRLFKVRRITQMIQILRVELQSVIQSSGHSLEALYNTSIFEKRRKLNFGLQTISMISIYGR